MSAPADPSIPLADLDCLSCDADTPALSAPEVRELLERLPDWQLREGPRILRRYSFEDFAKALAFGNLVGSLAEREDHHPRILLEWGLVELSLWTRAIEDLSLTDFILAAKCDRLYRA